MAALLLSTAGSAVGSAVFGPTGALVGRLAGALAGNAIDQALFGSHRERTLEGPRLSDLDVMAASEGAAIPRVYGRARLAGQVIWATHLEEVVNTSRQSTGGKGMGGGGATATTTTTTTYSYFANIAVALSEGRIGAVLRVWADGKVLDLPGLTMRVYSGDEAQDADPLIIAKQGQSPAYRGLAYVVFERLPLADFGNRIPQLSFEVMRSVGQLERMVRAVTLIPGATEFGYEPETVVRQLGPGQSGQENRHVTQAKSDVVAALDELQGIAPNVERVAVVVAWFGTDLRCGECRVVPGIDNAAKTTHGASWSVAGVNRATAYLVSQIDGRAAFGGTPSDQSVVNLIAELKARGLKITLYPFLMMDIAAGNMLSDPYTGAASQPVYPWRGRITCDPAPGQPGSPDGTLSAAAQVDAFFSGGPDTWNYRNMVLHYATLVAGAGGVDAFLIGSELTALTRVRSASGVYPAVDALVTLAANVKAIVGSGTVVSYGADGLGKPWVFRQKDIWNFWQQAHYERVGGVELGSPTAWVPQSKPIWLTEIGCPAVDKGANEPNVFPDPKSSESGLPHFSTGKRDDLMQRRFLEAVLGALDPAFGADSLNPVSPVYGGRMIAPDAIHLWTWDARPYPVFPAALDAWGDGGNWETGHWLTGRLGSAPLDGLVSAILADSGMDDAETGELGEGPDGYVVDRPMAPRAMLDPLALAFTFDAIEQDGTLRFCQRGGAAVAELVEDDLVLPDETAPARLARAQESDLPRAVSIGFTDIGADYQRAAAASRRLVGGSTRGAHADLAMVSNDAQAERRAEIWLQDLWAGRESAEFALPLSRLALAPGDVAGLTVNGRWRLIEIQEIVEAETRALRARSIDPDVFNVSLAPPRRRVPDLPAAVGPAHALVLDLPTLSSAQPAVLARLAVFADPWPGSVTVWSSNDGLSYSRAGTALAPAIAGETLDDLPAGPTARWHLASFRVQLYGGALASVSDAALLAGANVAALQRADGAWEVMQFAQAELTGAGIYTVSRLLRGQAGSEWAMAAPLPAGAPFVLLDSQVVTVASGIEALERTLQLRVVAGDRDTGDPSAVALTATPRATALRPLAPVHVKASRDGSGVTLTWIRRTRADGDSWTGEVPLGEDSEQYEVDILSGASVVRTLSATAPSALYAAASEIADFGGAQSSLSLRVVQMSATVGRGFAVEKVVVV